MKLLSWFKSLFTRKEQKKDLDDAKVDVFVHTWSVVEFARKYGKMQIGKFPERNNRDSFLKCRFVKSDNNYTYVSISSSMQNITPKEISETKDRIRVGQLPNKKFVLYDFRFKPWEDVDLGLS